MYPMMEVDVEDGKVDVAIKTLKKKLNRAGIFRKIKEKRFYEPPSAKKQRKRKEILRRAKKKQRKQRRYY